MRHNCVNCVITKTADNGTLSCDYTISEVKKPNKAFFFHIFAKAYPHSAVLLGDYKLLKFWKTYKVEFYNVVKDLGEINDISKNERVKTKDIEGVFIAYIIKNDSELLIQSIK